METSNKKRSAPISDDNHNSNLMNYTTKKKKISSSSSSSLNITESPIAGTRITEWEEYEKWKEIRGDIEPTMNYVEITPEAIEELRKIKNIIGDYICQLCKVKYENAFALAMHKCPRVVHIEFRCPECDKTFNCPANLASHRRWHKPQISLSSNESVKQTTTSSSTQKSTTNKHPRCSSRSDSRSTNTSSSIVSDTVHDYASLSASSSNMDTRKKDSFVLNGTHKKNPEQVFRTLYNESSQWMVPPSFQPFTTSHMKSPLIFRHHRSLPMSIPSSFDFRRLQSSCIFCHEQFSELNHLLQHIRKTHAVTSSTNTKNATLTLDKIVF
ncbi:unnamed protein product [Rotaria sp. Silwood1]|nr:unnamed protein product [Rotaria sp. Silwood1]CAF3420925.1 unnamed protein product [Rotaria sp. Silwood1]CAF3471271.1 unnamed protein product [Rotaria sp. Silwood1]CAF3478209.1 unnamed protein product [Rotaria sp. Silwood1]CAF4657007.1 unnamed protein product [Rotaria sp. Silwood1]